MSSLRIALAQMDILWENKTANFHYLKQVVGNTCAQETPDIVVLPEMFSTGFSMHSHELAESFEGETISQLTNFAIQFEVAIVGSFICKEEESYYNRAFFITPKEAYFYDKHHLFRMGGEAQSFSPGNERVIVTYKQWQIMLLVCYDLRFPVWSRNRGCEYDLCIYVANWPASRIHVWDALLVARALENQTYVCGVNRVGIDGNGISYNGHSKLIDARGEVLLQLFDEKACTEIVTIDKEPLLRFREKFPVWMDAD